MPKSCIPGYDDAIAKERKLRESIFLGVPYDICGVKVQNITPFLLTRLRVVGTPFLDGGQYSAEETIKFLWMLSPSFTTDNHPATPWYRNLLGRKRISVREAFIKDCTRHLFRLNALYQAEVEIDRFIKYTFMDGSSGGSDSVPFVTGIAYTVFSFMKPPYNWTEEKTLHTPYRKLYQYKRCQKLENDDILRNEISDPIKEDWLVEYRNLQTGGNN